MNLFKPLCSKGKNYLLFDKDVQQYNSSRTIDIFDMCNSILVTVIGSDNVLIDGELLFASLTPATVAGDSLSIGGNQWEVYVRRFMRIQFVTTVAPLVQVTQKFYVNVDL